MKILKNLLISCLIFNSLLLIQESNAQVVINEICSKNDSVVKDNFGEYSDFIELYNASNLPYDLSNHYLSDKKNDLKKWQFPNVKVPAKGFLLIFASNRNLRDSVLHSNFKIAQNGENISLSDSFGNPINLIEMPFLLPNHSFGRQTDGDSTWVIFTEPSPDSSNNNKNFELDYSHLAPFFSQNSGFYPNQIAVEIISNLDNATIRYTLDGSEPTDSSSIYSSSLEIDTTTVLKARTFASNFESKTRTASFFIQENVSLPVFSISTNSNLLFQPDSGIYMFGANADSVFPFYGANFWQEKEIPIYIEYFDENKNLAFAQQADLEIHGGRSARTKAMRPFRILAKNKYGEGFFNYPLFPSKNINQYKRFVLRNSGSDFNKTHFRDAIINQELINKTHIDANAYEPVLVFINGKFWGIYNLREKLDKYYLKSNYNLDENNVDLLEKDTMIVEGNFNDFNVLFDFVKTKDLSTKENFDFVESQIDLENFMDYFIAETYFNNFDWPLNNIKYWKEKSPKGKWRYLFFDLDVSLGHHGWSNYDKDNLGRILTIPDSLSKHAFIFNELLKNQDFKNNFINRYADLMNTLFLAENWENAIRKTKSKIEPEMQRHLNQWNTKSFQSWENEIENRAIPFVLNRPEFARNFIEQNFNLQNQVNLRLDIYPPNAGKIHLNTLEIDNFPWNGIYFNGVPVKVSIEQNPGYRFKYWESKSGEIYRNKNPNLEFNFENDAILIAHFEGNLTIPEIQLVPNPAKQNVILRFYSDVFGEAEIKIYNALGKKVLEIPTSEINIGLNEITLELNNLIPGIYFVQLASLNRNQTLKLVLEK